MTCYYYKSDRKFFSRVALTFITLLLVLPKFTYATAITVDSVRGYNGSIHTWKGEARPGTVITIEYTTITGGTDTVTATAKSPSGATTGRGFFSVDQPADVKRPQIAKATAPGCPSENVKTTASNAINRGSVFTAHTVLVNSTVSVDGNAFTITEGFTTRPSFYDDDINSPNYGDMEASIDSDEFTLFGVGDLGDITFSINSAIEISTNILDILPIALGGNGDTSLIIDSILVEGIIDTDFAGAGTFIGSISGTIFPSDLASTMELAINFDSSFGSITGNIFTSGQTTVVPEPPILFLFLFFLGTIIGIRYIMPNNITQKGGRLRVSERQLC